ncbi:hypothetical protein PBI_SOUPS_53 [Gordonia phage Soups]|uniref:Uncharacterized protein n=1 Tax=Gordonia phage Soups TaxID=1838079 RepID=A0A160DG73_9CAUD|nr:hypothetical protein BEN59_gp058 [Gordonia phage Soups]ANA86988.1 hypothetical protein PBI_SOUPS_53 [Gordonia phage Soups]WIC40145.1 hypothetical protein SEA_BATTLESHIP_54 [Gordonia phage Battleship]
MITITGGELEEDQTQEAVSIFFEFSSGRTAFYNEGRVHLGPIGYVVKSHGRTVIHPYGSIETVSSGAPE